MHLERMFDSLDAMERVVKHWWNGNWGRLARRDVYLRADADRRWVVEARTGGAEGRSRWQVVKDERAALALAQRWLDLGGSCWRDVSGAHQRS
jgi:hypothetical protein